MAPTWVRWARSLPVVCASLLALGLWQTGSGAWIHLKAALAQWLLEQAWSETLRTGRPTRPWPWADTWPLARLHVPRLGVTRIVLSGDSGRTLAFGPGHTPGSALPGEGGAMIISGHRDTHFRFVKTLRPSDSLIVESPRGRFHYQVTRTPRLDARRDRLVSDPVHSQLYLVTCYPFDAVRAGGPGRYVVVAARSSTIAP